MIPFLLLGAALAYLGWSLNCMERNVRKARSMQVPVVRLPVDVTNVLWLTLQPAIFAVLDRLPIDWFSYPDFIRFSRRDWQFREKARPAVRLGPVWALVTPVTIYLQITDPEAIRQIFDQPYTFVRPVKEYKLLEVYGPCLSTAGSDDWARHRKILAAPFNENIMKLVWDESLRQVKSLLVYWDASKPSIASVQQDFQTVAINVLAATAFKKSYGFQGSAEEVRNDSGSYRSTLATVLDNAILLMLIPYHYMKGPFVPKKLVKVGDAARAFKGHMIDMLDEEKKALQSNKSGSGGMMSSFVRALDIHTRELAESPELKVSKDGKRGLSIDEIFGNVFILNFAGYDTTANIIAFASYLLAIKPEVQDWLAEEVAAVAGSSEAPIETWDYNTFFPQLKRCRAILLETLRLYPPIVAIPKWTAHQPQTLNIRDTHNGNVKTITIPPGVYTSPHIIAIHSHSEYWNDAEDWRPSRWISSHSTQMKQDIINEELIQPAQNTYFPWSDGPQSCPGKKFIQVEAAAVFALLFKNHRISVVKSSGESDQAMKKRVMNCMNSVNMDVILKMQDPDQIKLMCTKLD